METHLNDNEIVKCSSCHKILTYKEFDTHKCKIPWKATRTILVHYCLELSDDGKEILAVAHDGTHYLLKIKKPHAIPFIRRKKTPYTSDADEPEPYSTFARAHWLASPHLSS